MTGETVATPLIAIDLGGTHVRFALAEVVGERVASLGKPVTLLSDDYDGLPAAWAAFERQASAALPNAAALSVAGPVENGAVKLTNLPWQLDWASLRRELHLDELVMINDFEAVGHAVAQLGTDHFQHVCGPCLPLPANGVISIVGPGTGFGVAQLWRSGDDYRVVPTEGGHSGFAPVDPFEDRLVATLRARFGRVSIERIASGPAITEIFTALGGELGCDIDSHEDETIWERGISGEDGLARQAVEQFCRSLGSIAGDFALAHGASGVVIAGGVGLRLGDFLPRSGFAERFVAKGRFKDDLQQLPVQVISHAEPGLFGAAAAFARTAAGARR